MDKKASIFTVYSPEGDMTFIMREMLGYHDDRLISTECVSWHYGSPTEDDLIRPEFYGLKAEF